MYKVTNILNNFRVFPLKWAGFHNSLPNFVSRAHTTAQSLTQTANETMSRFHLELFQKLRYLHWSWKLGAGSLVLGAWMLGAGRRK